MVFGNWGSGSVSGVSWGGELSGSKRVSQAWAAVDGLELVGTKSGSKWDRSLVGQSWGANGSGSSIGDGCGVGGLSVGNWSGGDGRCSVGRLKRNKGKLGLDIQLFSRPPKYQAYE